MKSSEQLLSMLCLAGIIGVNSPAFGETFLSAAIRYDISRDNGSPQTTGSELTLPLGFAYRGERLSLSAETAYSNAYVEDTENAEASISSFTDTLLSATYITPLPNRPVALLFGIDANLPTGHERLSEAEESAEWGESNDLFEVDNFGEGFNLGLSFGAMHQYEDTAVAFQGAYVFTGDFDPSSDYDDDNLDPGDQLLLLCLLNTQASSWLSIEWLMVYSYFWPDKTEGIKTFQQGNQFMLGGNMTVTREPITISTHLQATFPKVNKELVDESWEQEYDNSNGIHISGAVIGTYTLSEKLTLQLQSDIRYYGASDLQDEETGFPYSGKRIRYAVAPGITYLFARNLSLYGGAELFAMTQEHDIFTEEDLFFRGLNIQLSALYTF
jgi:hypothetical protein